MRIQFDEWLRVKADSADAARRFFGAPPEWPCKLDPNSADDDPVYMVKSESLTVGMYKYS